MVEFLPDLQNIVSFSRLHVPRSIFINKKDAESFLSMLDNTIEFERPLKRILKTFFPLHKKTTPYEFNARIEKQDFLKVGKAIYDFEKEFEANSIKSNSNAGKRDALSSPSKNKLSKRKAIFKAHPDIWKAQSQLSVQNENSELLDSNDEDRIFIIQNAQRKCTYDLHFKYSSKILWISKFNSSKKKNPKWPLP
ncbi:hypothetical protein HMI56_004263 [Coelomomyces lativittatus]|nr:hypothetical protein HMI56_004263 [Coelomomyces lativittatus]